MFKFVICISFLFFTPFLQAEIIRDEITGQVKLYERTILLTDDVLDLCAKNWKQDGDDARCSVILGDNTHSIMPLKSEKDLWVKRKGSFGQVIFSHQPTGFYVKFKPYESSGFVDFEKARPTVLAILDEIPERKLTARFFGRLSGNQESPYIVETKTLDNAVMVKQKYGDELDFDLCERTWLLGGQTAWCTLMEYDHLKESTSLSTFLNSIKFHKGKVELKAGLQIYSGGRIRIYMNLTDRKDFPHYVDDIKHLVKVMKSKFSDKLEIGFIARQKFNPKAPVMDLRKVAIRFEKRDCRQYWSVDYYNEWTDGSCGVDRINMTGKEIYISWLDQDEMYYEDLKLGEDTFSFTFQFYNTNGGRVSKTFPPSLNFSMGLNRKANRFSFRDAEPFLDEVEKFNPGFVFNTSLYVLRD